MKNIFQFKFYLTTLFLLFTTIDALSQNIGINNDGSSPDASAILDVKSLNKGILIPRTKTDAILAPVKGLMIFDTTINNFAFYDGAAWNQLGSGGSGWSLSGNNNIIDGNHFIGTINKVPLTIRVNNLRAGRIDTDTPSITSFGYKALLSNTTGINNTAFGYRGLEANSTGSGNTSMGYLALINNKKGNSNSAFGSHSMWLNDSGVNNAAFGYQSLVNNIGGSGNTALGNSSLFANTSGVGNTASGHIALYANTTGFYNNATGINALRQNTTGFGNTADGAFALYSSITPRYNTAVGHYTMYAHVSGNNNTAIGANALMADSSGFENTVVGSAAMTDNKSGHENTATGSLALFKNVSGSYNTASGYASLYGNTTGYGNTAFGFRALFRDTTGSHNTAMGDSATTVTGNLENTTVIGARARVSASYTMAFGDSLVKKWAFGRDSVETGALQVGRNNTNGNGAYLTPGGVWTDVSASYLKDGFEVINQKDILEKIIKLPVTKWKYKGTQTEYHIGPMAEDFQYLFGIGDGKSVSAMDKSGVALLGIQALEKENEELKKMIQILEERLQKLEQKNDK